LPANKQNIIITETGTIILLSYQNSGKMSQNKPSQAMMIVLNWFNQN